MNTQEPKEEWEELIKNLISIWIKQGRTEEQVYGVKNFFTGIGGIQLTKYHFEKLSTQKQSLLDKLINELNESNLMFGSCGCLKQTLAIIEKTRHE